MKIQINTDKNVEISENKIAWFSELIAKDLDRFNGQITRIEVHLSDENGSKEGPEDRRCLLEARVEGMQPLAVTNQADSDEHAVKGAVDKLKNLLSTRLGRMKNH
ncbi:MULTISPECIES: HPF/RaiA family ribosome-associated protein [Rhodonellum]|uniref:HPF/RaiA family ribosome-associated protein n=1 Tax=Rhodonellum ikkaensis TaxID=336829 RepID=A0A1H3U0S6_9BACT|nr:MULTISPECIES: HPF/RaiA family ribosome-associated protein [Rhodonellum]MDO9551904.1 HPF/RaiA family ribosome-associated protein [Rhodonellum sp.]SDZ55917.1 hypothetical protein SAMN05444412_12423 [Rhodonellum ikkaensis]